MAVTQSNFMKSLSLGDSHIPESLMDYGPWSYKSWTELKQLGRHIHTPSLYKVQINSENIYKCPLQSMCVHIALFYSVKNMSFTEMGFPGDSDGRNLHYNLGDLVGVLGWEKFHLEKGAGTHSQ